MERTTTLSRYCVHQHHKALSLLLLTHTQGAVTTTESLQWVAGIKKTGFRGTPPFLSLSTALIHPTPWFLSSGRGTQARAPARRIFR